MLPVLVPKTLSFPFFIPILMALEERGPFNVFTIIGFDTFKF